MAAITGAGPGFARGPAEIEPPNLHTTLTAVPSPPPTTSEGRIPVSLRLANSVWTDDGSHPPAATEVQFKLDRHLRFDLSGVPRCPWAPIQMHPAFDWDSCKPAMIGSGRIKWEVAFPEEEAFRTGGEAAVYRGIRNKLLIRTYLPAPVSGAVVIPVALGPVSGSIYGLSATAAIPRLASGSGSLTYLGLRFRKGLFSAACPKGRLQSQVVDTFTDGTRAAGGLIINC